MTAAEPDVQPRTDDPLTAGPNPVIDGRRTAFQHSMIYVFVAGPMDALVAAVPLAWGWGGDWQDLVLLGVFYTLAGVGVGGQLARPRATRHFPPSRFDQHHLLLPPALHAQGVKGQAFAADGD